jgi:hypothetical protein
MCQQGEAHNCETKTREAAVVELASLLGKELADQGSNPGSSHLLMWAFITFR